MRSVIGRLCRGTVKTRGTVFDWVFIFLPTVSFLECAWYRVSPNLASHHSWSLDVGSADTL